MITCYPVHACLAQRCATKQITTTNNQSNLHSDTNQPANFQRHTIHHFRIDTKIMLPQQRLATEFEQNPLISWLSFWWCRHEIPFSAVGGYTALCACRPAFDNLLLKKEVLRYKPATRAGNSQLTWQSRMMLRPKSHNIER